MKKLIVTAIASVLLTGTASAATVAERNAAWKTFSAKAVALSKQAYGEARVLRACQPKLAVCSTFVVFPLADGSGLGMLRETEDARGKIVDRDTCELNEHLDVRTCHDFDTGATIKEMRDPSGDWYTVGNK